MAQRQCEICDDPLPVGSSGSICDECQKGIDIEIGLVDEAQEEAECETTVSVEVSSSSATPVETTPEPPQAESTSGNSAAPDAAVATPSDEWDWDEQPTPSAAPILPAPTPEPTPAQQGIDLAIAEARKVADDPTKEVKGTECEACGFIQKELKDFKVPTGKEPLRLCDKCFADEVALKTPQLDAAMQGKIVHPDEAERDEILSMDEEDRVLYNEEVLINASVSLDFVQSRIELLERRLHRAKVQLRASKRTLTMRVSNLEKKARDEEYRKMGERLATKRKRQQGDATNGATKKAATPRATGTDKIRRDLKAAGFSDAWIDEQIKKMGK